MKGFLITVASITVAQYAFVFNDFFSAEAAIFGTSLGCCFAAWGNFK